MSNGLPWEGRSNLPWDHNSWDVASEIAARQHRFHGRRHTASRLRASRPSPPSYIAQSAPVSRLGAETWLPPSTGAMAGTRGICPPLN
jgi:hypothetical protein